MYEFILLTALRVPITYSYQLSMCSNICFLVLNNNSLFICNYQLYSFYLTIKNHLYLHSRVKKIFGKEVVVCQLLASDIKNHEVQYKKHIMFSPEVLIFFIFLQNIKP